MATTPQALGAMIKRTGIMKSQDRKGNMYNYHTEGYSLVRQYGKRYTFNYYGRLQMARLTEAQEQALNERRRDALNKVLNLMMEKNIRTELEGTTLIITLED
jgi:predicted DNA-binding WGR domain protein